MGGRRGAGVWGRRPGVWGGLLGEYGQWSLGHHHYCCLFCHIYHKYHFHDSHLPWHFRDQHLYQMTEEALRTEEALTKGISEESSRAHDTQYKYSSDNK